jgi:DNA-binding winged helix-turn-helix (wHTH) protein
VAGQPAETFAEGTIMNDDRSNDAQSNDQTDWADSHSRVQFGPFEADFRTQELRKEGLRLKLSGQPFHVLQMLLLRPGALVTRDELQKRLWPNDPFTDSNHGLNAAVNKLREALGDSADEPKYIETLPRRGYRFIAAIDKLVPAPAAELLASLEPEPLLLPAVSDERLQAASTFAASRPARSWLTIAASLGILLCGIAAVSFVARLFWDGASQSAQVDRDHEIPLMADPNLPDKFEAAKDQIRERLRITRHPTELPSQEAPVAVPAVFRTAGTTEPTMRTIISGDGGAAGPQFSPDGKRIAFMSNRTGPWQIWVSNTDGSEPRQVSFTSSAGTPRWSPDGHNIVFDGPGDGGSSIFVVRADGSGRSVAVAEGLVPSYSRDGQWIYFASDRIDDWQVWKVHSSGGNAVQVTHDGGFAALEGLDGYLYYAKTRNAAPEVWRVPLSGGEENLVSRRVRPRTWSSWTVTRTGILFVEDLRDGKTALSLYDPAKQVVRDLAPLDTAPFWMAATPDGKRAVINDAGEKQITMLDNLQ